MGCLLSADLGSTTTWNPESGNGITETETETETEYGKKGSKRSI